MDSPTRFEPGDEHARWHFVDRGWVIVTELAPDDVAILQHWVDEVANWPVDGGPWIHHFELTDDGPQLCRTENFVPFHAGLRRLLDAQLPRTASLLLGEPVVLYKEKINYKLRGGAGFLPHQDAQAYPFVDTHVSCMLAIDDATEANGCLEVVDNAHHHLLPTDERGCIIHELTNSMTWRHLPLRAGEALWFHSRAPHRSAANLSATDRRALYPTYNAASAGDLRSAYYAAKLAALAASAPGERVVMSLIGDFEGRPVDHGHG